MHSVLCATHVCGPCTAQAVCGSPEIPVAAIRDSARYEMDKDSPVVRYLWEALEMLTNEERSLFLRFVTGRGRLPVSIKIQSKGGSAQCA